MNFFTPEELSIISNAKKVVVAFSGGPDSTLALLATKQNLKDSSKLSALHINHQTQNTSSEWEQDCEKLCQKLSIMYESVKIKVKVEDQGFEAAARVARQKVFQQLESGTVLILGHHADDQVETVLFRIFRGTGIKGLAGMKRISRHGDLIFIRPLMGLNKSEILNCLKAVKQEFIIDETNNENVYSRNFLI
jgi:tRNA(Ile)-lysidine synthase